MWSTTKGHHIDQKIIRFAPAQVAGSGMVDSGQTVCAVVSAIMAGLPETSLQTITIPGLSVTEADTVQTVRVTSRDCHSTDLKLPFRISLYRSP